MEAAAQPTARPAPSMGYGRAFLDWLACAVGGREQPAARAARTGARGLEGRALALGTAGHVLDYDDTYLPGLVHLSAPTAPAALALGAEVGASAVEVLAAYAAGFEAMAAVARASHPALYDRRWHPTAVCGVVGAATAAAQLLELGEGRTRRAVRLALLGAGGLRAAFGSDGKSLQVGMAAATGLRAARLTEAGASVPDGLPEGFQRAYGGRWAEPDEAEQAIGLNWIKAYPCCLQAHSAIEAASAVRDEFSAGELVTITVHPISRQAAPFDDVESGLEAKFSIPYLAAFSLAHGPPGVEDLQEVDPAVRRHASTIHVRTDPGLAEPEAVLETEGGLRARVDAPLGSPDRPMDDATLGNKVRSLSGSLLQGALERPAAELVAVVETG